MYISILRAVKKSCRKEVRRKESTQGFSNLFDHEATFPFFETSSLCLPDHALINILA